MVSTMSPADAWQRNGMPSDRSYPSGRSPHFDRDREDYSPRSSRSAPPPPPPPPRSRAADRGRSADRMSAPERRYPGENPREAEEYRRPPAGRRSDAPRARSDRGLPPEGRPVDPRGASARPARGHERAAETGGSRLRGIVAVLGVFLVTLAGCAVDSFLSTGLGTITLIALVGTTALATVLVRRRDVLSVVVAPPLIFVAVAAIDVAAAPSASFSLATIATLLIRGFPAMGIATGVALVIGLIRLAARR
jgi:hypothetical protein